MNNLPNNKPAPPIQKTVPVRKNGFILELQVAPPGNAQQIINSHQGQFQQANQNPQFQGQPAQALPQQPFYNQAPQQNQPSNQEFSEEKKTGIMPSLRDLFNR